MLTHNAALNRVLDEGKKRGFLTDVDRPTLESKGRDSIRRADFSMTEVRALLAGFDPWIERARNKSSKESRSLMRDYAMVLLDTGARSGVELLQLKWRQISVTTELTSKRLEGVDDEGEPIDAMHLNRTVMMSVAGKNKNRDMVGMQRTGLAINNIAKRNYPDLKRPIEDPLKNIKAFAKDDFIFRKKDKSDPSPSFQKMFASYLKEHGLLLDPKTNQKRVFYSLRHTYATLALTHDEVPIHTLAKQMGTSVLMIEKHYSHLDVIKAIHQLRGNESRQLIEAGGVVDDAYRSNRA
jgi:integrase